MGKKKGNPQNSYCFFWIKPILSFSTGKKPIAQAKISIVFPLLGCLPSPAGLVSGATEIKATQSHIWHLGRVLGHRRQSPPPVGLHGESSILFAFFVVDLLEIGSFCRLLKRNVPVLNGIKVEWGFSNCNRLGCQPFCRDLWQDGSSGAFNTADFLQYLQIFLIPDQKNSGVCW